MWEDQCEITRPPAADLPTLRSRTARIAGGECLVQRHRLRWLPQPCRAFLKERGVS